MDDDDWLDHSDSNTGVEATSEAITRQFNTLGFKEGLAAVYEQTLQGGFDVGFAVGFPIGWGEAQLLGAVSTLIDVLTPAAHAQPAAAAGAAGGPTVRSTVRLRLGREKDGAADALKRLHALAGRIQARISPPWTVPDAAVGDASLRGDSDGEMELTAARAALAELLRDLGLTEAAWPSSLSSPPVASPAASPAGAREGGDGMGAGCDPPR